MSKEGKAIKARQSNTPFKTKPYSIFAIRPIDRDTRNESFTRWELLTDYLKRRFISRKQVKKLAKLKYLAVSSFRNRLYVCEICIQEIDDWLVQ